MRGEPDLRDVRMPFEPLERYVQLNTRPVNDTNDALRLGEHVGFQNDSVHRWRENGGVPFRSADRAAITLGTHPALIWPEWFDVAVEYDTDQHGTRSGVYWHSNHGVPICEECSPVSREIWAERKRTQRKRKREQHR